MSCGVHVSFGIFQNSISLLQLATSLASSIPLSTTTRLHYSLSPHRAHQTTTPLPPCLCYGAFFDCALSLNTFNSQPASGHLNLTTWPARHNGHNTPPVSRTASCSLSPPSPPLPCAICFLNPHCSSLPRLQHLHPHCC